MEHMFDQEADAPVGEPLSAEAQDALAERARAVATQISVLQAEYAALAARIAASATPAGCTARQWLCLSTGVTPAEAARAVRIGTKLAELPAIASVFEAGSVSEGVVDAMVRVATPTNEAALVEAASVASGAQLIKLIRSYQKAAPTEPDGEPPVPPAERPDEFWGHFDEDGRYRFGGDVGAELGATMASAIAGEQAEDRRLRDLDAPDGVRPGEGRLLSRAEALANIFAGYLAQVAAGRADGLVPSSHQAIVHLDKADIDAGWQNQAARLHDADAIDPQTARRMACDAAWRAVVMNDLDPEGVTREHRLAGPGQRAAAYVRDRACSFPGCNRTRWLKLHHLHHAAAGGTTRLDNLVCLCQLHHSLIHKPGWQITGTPGNLTFIRPDGTTVGSTRRPPPDQLPAPPTVDPHDRFLPTGEPLTTWARDTLLSYWLSLAA